MRDASSDNAKFASEPAGSPQSLRLGEQPSAPTQWTFRDLGFLIVFAIFALLASNFIALAGYAVLKPWMGWRIRPESLAENPFFLLAMQSIFHGMMLGYVFLLIVVNYRLPFWSTLKWRNPTLPETVRYLLGGILLAFAIQLAPALLPETQNFPLERLFSSPSAGYAIAFFAVVVAPFMEELIFRGVLFSIFEIRMGLGFAVLSTAVLFGCLHIQEYWGAWNHVLLIMLVGLVFSLARAMTGSLAPSVLLHIAYNATLMVGLYVGTHHFRNLGGILAS